MKLSTSVYFIISLLFSLSAHGQDLSSPETVVESMFRAVKNRDAATVKACMHPESEQRSVVIILSNDLTEEDLQMYETKYGELSYTEELEEIESGSKKGWVPVKVELMNDVGELRERTVYCKKDPSGYGWKIMSL